MFRVLTTLPATAETADATGKTGMAVSVRADGASLDETCAWARSLARSRLSHPSNMAPRPHLRLVEAS